MYVLVHLQNANRHIVVPESFVYELDELSTKNYGVNRNQVRLIYFSFELFEILNRNEIPNREFPPNFNLPITIEYPLPMELKETCFNGRIISFECKLIIFMRIGK